MRMITLSGNINESGLNEHHTPTSLTGRHIWHFCKVGQHAKCKGFGCLTARRGNPAKTYVLEGVRNQGRENVYCECRCHVHMPEAIKPLPQHPWDKEPDIDDTKAPYDPKDRKIEVS